MKKLLLILVLIYILGWTVHEATKLRLDQKEVQWQQQKKLRQGPIGEEKII